MPVTFAIRAATSTATLCGGTVRLARIADWCGWRGAGLRQFWRSPCGAVPPFNPFGTLEIQLTKPQHAACPFRMLSRLFRCLAAKRRRGCSPAAMPHSIPDFSAASRSSRDSKSSEDSAPQLAHPRGPVFLHAFHLQFHRTSVMRWWRPRRLRRIPWAGGERPP